MAPLLALVLLALSAAFAAGGPEAAAVETRPGGALGGGGADKIFLDGRDAFMKGDDERAADLLVRAARTDWRCLALLDDDRYRKWLPSRPCSEVSSLQPAAVEGDIAPYVLYRLALIRRAWVREREGEIALRSAGHFFLEKAAGEYGRSPWAARSALLLLLDRLCIDDAGYPDCLALEITRIEEWLGDYSDSSERFEVIERLASSYLELADLYERDEPWQSMILGELCRGRALQAARALADNAVDNGRRRRAREMVRRIRGSGKPYSIVPEGALKEPER